MRKHKSKVSFIPVIGLVIFGGILFVIFYSAGWFAKKSDFFKIREIIINGNEGGNIALDYLKGRNIFTIDLKKEECLALRMYPVCKTIKLIKILPSRIFADSVIRKPIAYVKLYKYFYVDEDCMLFDSPVGLEQFDGSTEFTLSKVEGLTINPQRGRRIDLPVILGLDAKIFGPKKERKYDVKELTAALKIIKRIKNNVMLKDLVIKKIDAADLVNMSVFLFLSLPSANEAIDKTVLPLDLLEVKIGQEYIDEKVDIFGNLFAQSRNDFGNIKYIDLRFKDPVIKFKEQ